jgi:hypothetical protein
MYVVGNVVHTFLWSLLLSGGGGGVGGGGGGGFPLANVAMLSEGRSGSLSLQLSFGPINCVHKGNYGQYYQVL